MTRLESFSVQPHQWNAVANLKAQHNGLSEQIMDTVEGTSVVFSNANPLWRELRKNIEQKGRYSDLFYDTRAKGALSWWGCCRMCVMASKPIPPQDYLEIFENYLKEQGIV